MLATAALTAALISPLCSWDKPGANKYSGNIAEAVQNYSDIPTITRNKLQKKIEARKYDEIATIKRDSISGEYEYTDLREMHFGKNQLCQTVTREKWKDNAVERGLVYCEDGFCVIVPTVCNNVSRITRKARLVPAAIPPGGGAGGGAGGGIVITPILPPLAIDEPTFETVINKDILPPSLIVSEEPYWFPILPPVRNPIGDSCCYITRPPIIPPPVPEPSTILMMACGLALLLRLTKSRI